MRRINLFYAMLHRKDPSRRTRERWGNFGDELNPILFERLFGIQADWASPRACDALAIGSVLDKFHLARASQILQTQRWLPRDRIVWGSGFMRAESRIRGGRMQVYAVRGPESLTRLPAKGEVAFGDPGLLVGEITPRRSEKQWAVGFTPHYVDQQDPRLKAAVAAGPRRRIIDILAHPDDVLAEMDACDVIVSSSLHGLIAADALGIPNLWAPLSDKLIGGGFKFHDYWAGVGKPAMAAADIADPAAFERALADPPAAASREVIERACEGLKRAAVAAGF